jgi:hypothetical protein
MLLTASGVFVFAVLLVSVPLTRRKRFFYASDVSEVPKRLPNIFLQDYRNVIISIFIYG